MPAGRVAGASLRASPADSGNAPNEARAALEIDRAHCLKPFAVTRRHGLDPTSKHHRRARSPGVAKAQPPEMIGFHFAHPTIPDPYPSGFGWMGRFVLPT